MLKTIFINGMLMLSVPVVFLAIARVVVKPHTSGLTTMTIKKRHYYFFNFVENSW
ncbi:hypothetical protein [Spiroplasma endosymbiont of Clivina fossor]|uniref:hypothetical protein n=1 Tax=Spiroplasma endosymbiont of Clivina fossor TaxID=3066282 RepID=UPI003CC7B040